MTASRGDTSPSFRRLHSTGTVRSGPGGEGRASCSKRRMELLRRSALPAVLQGRSVHDPAPGAEGPARARDERRELWRSFLEVVRLARPRAVLMENVPDMALDREMFILRAMVHELEHLGYAVEERVVNTWQYGVPQFRQRLILVALAGTDGVRLAGGGAGQGDGLERDRRPPRGGGWLAARRAVRTVGRPTRARSARSSAACGRGPDSRRGEAVRPHHPTGTRGRRRAFELMDTNTRYSDLPDEMSEVPRRHLRRQVQAPRRVRPVAHDHRAHRQGRVLVHPPTPEPDPDRPRGSQAADLPRPLPVRRPAVDGVPADRQRRTTLARRHLGSAIRSALDTGSSAGPSSGEIAASLATWFGEERDKVVPWLTAETRWQVISADLLLERLPFSRYVTCGR